MARIAVVAVKGGVGKTTLSNEIAFSLDRTGTPYSYYDMDGQRGGTHTETETEGADVMIADTPAAAEADDLERLAQAADVVVIPTRTGRLEMYSMTETVQTVRRANPDAKIIIVHNATNRYRLAREYREWLDSHADGASVYALPQAEAIPQAQALGQSVITYAKRSRAAQAMRDVVDAVRIAAGLDAEGARNG